MARYVLRNGQWLNRSTGEPLLSANERKAPISLPYVVSDIPEYRSPIDGRLITSRSERRDDLKRNGCVEYEPSMAKKLDRDAVEERRRRKIEKRKVA